MNIYIYISKNVWVGGNFGFGGNYYLFIYLVKEALRNEML